jgi:beta-galactosidase
MRTVLPFNDSWLFLPADAGDDVPDSAFARVTLPHTNRLFPHHNFDSTEYQFVSTYRKRFTLPEPRAGRRAYVDFDGAMIASVVSLNGHELGEHKGGFTPFSFELTDHLIDDGENLLSVRLDSTERKDIPPFGHVVDYLTFGGIYREVRLRLVEPCHITNVSVKPQGVLTATPALEGDVRLKNQGAAPCAATLRATLKDAAGDALASQDLSVTVPADADSVATVLLDALPSITLWSLDNPALYYLEVALLAGGALLDVQTERFGFRAAEFRPDGGFYLNGARLKLIGLNRHQTYPYIGAAASARLQRQDADILKRELALNIVRTSHYPQSPHFLDRCDEVGLLVFEEIPAWQHIGDAAWQALTLRDVRAMIERDRNHPSIILWGVRINESQDNEALYTATNALAHELDPTRQTGGVRYFQESQFLEDVFTFNDFSNTVVEPVHTPHLVTEFSGHMFPTKSWDQEERLIEHALRHARIQDKQLGMDKVAGAIGWCAFDYNTHQEFGSGDRICYHGVMDIFRLPKYAAYFYESQVSPEARPVLRAATIWSMGDRSGGGNDPLVVFSNCEAIEVYVGDRFHGRFEPDRASFPNLPHPPYQITALDYRLIWGEKFTDLRLVGYVKGQPVAEQRIAADGLPHTLTLEADATELRADGADLTRLIFRIVDRYGNRLPYTNQVVEFALDGPADLIGENPFALMGGQAALYVRARQEPGTVTVRATTARLEPASVTITVR